MRKELIYPSILSLVAIFFRFSYSIPTAFLDDSVKYFVPLQIIKDQNFEWIFGTINFSILNRILAYFVQIAAHGDVSGLITIQKLFGLVSSLICFYLVLKLTKNQTLAFAISLLFAINPFIIFIENTVMAESIFIFTTALSSFLVYYLLEKDKQSIPIAFTLGLVLSLSVLAKETGWIWSICVLIVLSIAYLLEILKTKNLSNLILIAVLALAYFIPPIYISSINKKNFGEFTVNRYSTKGAILYIVTEEMLRKNPSKEHLFLTKLILQTTDKIRLKYEQNSELSAYDYQRAFYNAISHINVQGRVGNLSIDGKKLSSKAWSSLCFDFALKTSLQNPSASLKRVFKISIPNFFFSKNYTFNHIRKSQRHGLDLEPLQFTSLPFSFKNPLDPKIKKDQIIQGASLVNGFLKDHSKILYLINRDTSRAFYIEKPFALRWLDLFQHIGFIYLTFPLLLILIAMVIIKNFKTIKFTLIEAYILLSLLYFTVFQLALSQCEGRYRIQLQFFLLISIAILINKLFKKQDG